MVEFTYPSIVAEFMHFNDHRSVRLQVDLESNSKDDPLTLYVHYHCSKKRLLELELNDLEGKVIHHNNKGGISSVLCEFANLFKSSRALVRLESNFNVNFAKLRRTGIDDWKIMRINDFGNQNYQPPEPSLKKEDKELISPETPIKMAPTSRLTFYLRISKNGNTEVLIETLFKSLQGFVMCKKFKFSCDGDYVYYKMKFATAENIGNAVEVLNTLGFEKSLQMGEDFYRPAVRLPPISKLQHTVTPESNDRILQKFDVKGMLEDIISCSKKRKLDSIDGFIKTEDIIIKEEPEDLDLTMD